MKYIAPVGAANPDESYVTGNPATGTPGSRVGGPAIEHPMREIVHFIKASGLEPDEGNLSQLVDAFNEMMAGREVGRLGFRICDPANLPTLAPNELVPAGQELNRADYPKLWAYIEQSGCMVTDSQWQQPNMEAFYSSGNGSTTFRPGNLVTGAFPRFIDLSGLYDPDRGSRTGGNKTGSWQADAIRNIEGSFGSVAYQEKSGGETSGAFVPSGEYGIAIKAQAASSTPNKDGVKLDVSRVVETGSDNRPFNVLVLPVYPFK